MEEDGTNKRRKSLQERGNEMRLEAEDQIKKARMEKVVGE